MQATQEKYTKEILELARLHNCTPGFLATDSDAGALIPSPAPVEVSWKRWRAANGFVASYGSFSQEFPNVVTRAQKKAISFRGEKLPYVFFQPWATLVQIVAAPIRWFTNRFDPQPVQHSFGVRVIE